MLKFYLFKLALNVTITFNKGKVNFQNYHCLYFSEHYNYNSMRLWHKDLIDVLPRQQLIVQCFHNLEEKFDCGGISYEEFKRIKQKYDIIKTCQAKRNL